MSKELLACAIEAMTHASATIETLTGEPHRLSDNVIPRLREALTQQQEAQPQVPEGIVEKYNELLYHVARAFPNESRHETAVRYIKNAESSESYCVASKEEL